MNRRLGILCVPVLLLGACSNAPAPFAPPVQRQPLENFRPYRVSAIVDMADEHAEASIIQDVRPNPISPWRWTGPRPKLRLRMRTAENLRYTIDFTTMDFTLKSTGPVTLSFLVNDRVLDRIRYEQAGNQHFEKAVPDGLVIAGQDATVGVEIDKPWIERPGAPALGIILLRIGLTQ